MSLSIAVTSGCAGEPGGGPTVDGGYDAADERVDGSVDGSITPPVDGGPTGDFEPWTRTIGAITSWYEATAVGIDGSGNVVVAGSALGDLPFATVTDITTKTTSSRALVAKYDNKGNLAFATRMDEPNESASAGTTNASGVIYMVGDAPPSSTGDGANDVFLRTYDGAGTPMWSRRFGSSEDDSATAVAAHSNGNSVVVGGVKAALAGQTDGSYFDSFARMYDASGNVVWTRQFAADTTEMATGVVLDAAGNSFVVGYGATVIDPGQPYSDYYTYVRKLDPAGATIWSTELPEGTGRAIAIDPSGDLLVAGVVSGTLSGLTSAGFDDAFVWKLDASGTTVWTKQFGTSNSEYATAIAVDAQANVFVGGDTGGTFEGQTAAGYSDGFVRKYAADGTVTWTLQFGSSEHDTVTSVATDTGGNLYVAGKAHHDLPGAPVRGFNDAYVMKLPPQ